MNATPQPRVENDLQTLKSAVAQAQTSMMVPAYVRGALASAFRVIQSHEHELQALRAELAKVRGGAVNLKPGAY